MKKLNLKLDAVALTKDQMKTIIGAVKQVCYLQCCNSGGPLGTVVDGNCDDTSDSVCQANFYDEGAVYLCSGDDVCDCYVQ